MDVEKLLVRLREPSGDETVDYNDRLLAIDAIRALEREILKEQEHADNNALLWRAEANRVKSQADALEALAKELAEAREAIAECDRQAGKVEALLDPHVSWEGKPPEAQSAEIARLQRELEDVKAERDAFKGDYASLIESWSREKNRAEAAEARLSEMEKELERLRRERDQYKDIAGRLCHENGTTLRAARRLVEGDGNG